jgi:hypothetical protein
VLRTVLLSQGFPVLSFPSIVDVPQHYDLEVFNRCAEEGCMMLSLDARKEVHPSLVTIPLQVDYTIPYGILSALNPTPKTNQFLGIIRGLSSEVPI